MINYAKNYRKKDITKAYDLLELKANGRIDADGDYLDDEGNKLTIDCFIDSAREYDDSPYHYTIIQYNNFDKETKELMKSVGKRIIGLDGILRILKDKNGFIVQRKDGARFCEVRDIFLATYEQKNISLETIKTKLENLLLFANDINGQQIAYNDYSYLHDNLSEILDILSTDEEVQ